MVRAAEVKKFGRAKEAAMDPGVQNSRLTELSMGLLLRGIGYSKLFASTIGDRSMEDVVKDLGATDVPLGRLAPIR